MSLSFLKRDPDGSFPETSAERQARVAYERALLDEARADVAAGRLVSGAEADALIEAFERGEPLEIPDEKTLAARR